MKKIYLILLLAISSLSNPFFVSAQLGMPLPQCDKTVDAEIYFHKYIDAPDFKALHPTYSEWQLVSDTSQEKTVCINEGEKAILTWNFRLPASLSRFNFAYKYNVALVVNWDESAEIAQKVTPEALIAKTESLPGVQEFLTSYSNELAASTRWNNYWIGSSSYGESTGYTAPLEINYVTDNSDTIAVSEKGVDWADLNIHRQWKNFPTVNIGFKLVENALLSTHCTLDKSPTAVSRYSPTARKNDAEPEEFIDNNYNILCTDNEYRYSMANIYADGRYTVWLENREQIASGNLSESDIALIQVSRKASVEMTTPTTVPTAAAIATLIPKETTQSETSLSPLGIFALAAATPTFIIIAYLFMRYFGILKKKSPSPNGIENMRSGNDEKTPVVEPR